jgi:hypothetical protein
MHVSLRLALSVKPGESRRVAFAARGVEKMRPPRVRDQRDAVSRTHIRSIADRRSHFLVDEAAVDLRIGTGRLHHDHFNRETAGTAHGKVLRPDAVKDGLSLAHRRALRQRQSAPIGESGLECAVLAPHRARQQVHRGRADEAGHEGVGRLVVEV